MSATEGTLAARLAGIETHNGTPVTPENLRYAATHEALSRSWIFDVLTGLADLLAAEATDPAPEGDLPDPEVIGTDAGHWAAMENSGPTDLVCECGLPWAIGEGCQYVQGARAAIARLAARATDPGAGETVTEEWDEWAVDYSVPVGRSWRSGWTTGHRSRADAEESAARLLDSKVLHRRVTPWQPVDPEATR